MKKSSTKITVRNYYINMEWDIRFLIKVEQAKRVVKSVDEKREIFNAFVFRICSNWENLVEVLLIDCFNRETTRYRRSTGFCIPKNIEREICKSIILGIGYLNFKSIDNLKGIAKKFLVPRYNPFKEIPKPNGAMIDDFFKIRNYLAHYSYAARRVLEKVYKRKYGLRTFREPGGFLLAKDRRQKIPRIGVYLLNFIDTVEIMENFLM